MPIARPLSRLRRTCLALTTLSLSAAALSVAPLTASAADPLTTKSPSTTRVAANATTPLPGASVDGGGTSEVQTTVNTDYGTLSIDRHDDVELAYGNQWSGTSSITFSGGEQQVNAALADLKITTPDGAPKTADVQVSALPQVDGYVYSPTNEHFYQYIPSDGITGNAAREAATEQTFLDQRGYLASIPSADVNDLISKRIDGAQSVWIGARATISGSTGGAPTVAPGDVRSWTWGDGPLAGQEITHCTTRRGADSCTVNPDRYAGWRSGEPNNDGGAYGSTDDEIGSVLNYFTTSGQWNDLAPGATNLKATGYVVEYGDEVTGATTFDVATSESAIDVYGPSSAPTKVQADPGDRSATVSFEAPDDNGGDAVTGYRVTGSDGSVTDCKASPCTVKGLTNGVAYTFTVTALNAAGQSVASEASAAVTPASTPGAPTLTKATSGNAEVDVTFTAPKDNGGASITGFEATTDGGKTWEALNVAGEPGGDLNASITGLKNGETYSVAVRAVNSAGTSEASKLVDVTPATVPGPVRDLKLDRQSPTSVKISWTEPASDGGSPITGYKVVSTPDGKTCTTTSTSCTITGLETGIKHSFSVSATNADESKPGTGEGPAVTTETTTKSVPSAPQMLGSSAGDRVIDFTFYTPASDGGSTIVRYEISRDGGETWKKIKTSGSDPYTFRINGARNGKTYTTELRAVNDEGTGPSAGVKTIMPQWFHDQVSTSDRSEEVSVPKKPSSYHGKVKNTEATMRTHGGEVAVDGRTLDGRQLQSGQAFVFSFFAFDDASLSSKAKAQVKAATKSMRFVDSVNCEGYADYGSSASHEKKLSAQRADKVCDLIRAYASDVKTKNKAYGSKRPVVIGGKPADRAANRRVVVYVKS